MACALPESILRNYLIDFYEVLLPSNQIVPGGSKSGSDFFLSGVPILRPVEMDGQCTEWAFVYLPYIL